MVTYHISIQGNGLYNTPLLQAYDISFEHRNRLIRLAPHISVINKAFGNLPQYLQDKINKLNKN